MIWQANPQYIIWSIWAQDARRRFEQMKKYEGRMGMEVQKTWGHEQWFANNEKYCGKLISVKAGKQSSEGKFHYHKLKDETFFIVTGQLWLDIGDDETGEYQRLHLHENDSYRVMPGVKHRFGASFEYTCKFIEASTHHDESDSYRCYYDTEKEEWIDV